MVIKLSLIIPCYNEESTLQTIVEHVLEIRREDIELELVIVDDCSTDNSYEIASALEKKYPEIKLLRHEVNQGKGAALQTGFLEASGDYIGIQDADMEYDPKDYYTLLEPLLAGEADVVYGSRYLSSSTRQVLYFWHTLVNKILTCCSNMFTNLDITDMETCYKLFRRDVIHKIAPRLKEKRFGFEPEVTAYIAEDKCRIYECAIHYHPRCYGQGKKIGWKDGVRALYCILHYGAYNVPIPMQMLLYFFIGTSAVLSNLICFAILDSLEIALLPAIVSAYILSAVVNYILCTLILFRHRACWCTASKIAANVIMLLVVGILDYWMTAGLIFNGTNAMLAKVCASIVDFFGIYPLYIYFVFSNLNKK